MLCGEAELCVGMKKELINFMTDQNWLSRSKWAAAFKWISIWILTNRVAYAAAMINFDTEPIENELNEHTHIEFTKYRTKYAQ